MCSHKAAIKLGLSVDAKSIGKTASKTCFNLELPKGEHRISSSRESSSEPNLNAVNGSRYYIWQEAKMGMLTPGSKLKLASAEIGQKAVRECKRAAMLP